MNNKYSSLAATVVSRRGGKSKWPIILGCLGLLGFLFAVIVLGGYFYFLTTSAASQSVVLIREPTNGERLEAGQPVMVRALARDDRKVKHIELWVDGQLTDVQTSNTPDGINPFPLLATWYPPVGTHTLIVRAFNSRGAPSQQTITVEAAELVDQDMDGTVDETDLCPAEPGYSAADGCPDLDFDGIPDASDACPEEAGLPEDGCPAPSEGDRDGDGLLDEADACPDVPGSPLADGCLDADGDGISDSGDACPAEPGGGEDGCPEVGGSEAEPEPGGGGEPLEPFPGSDPPIAGDDDVPEGGSDLPGRGFPIGLPIGLEIEAYEMYVGYEFDRIRCYARLGELDWRPYEFEALGDRYWDIAAELGGENSETIDHEDDEIPLNISVNCLGYNPGEEPVELGEAVGVYIPEDWDGREHVLSTSVAGPAQYGFVIRFRICISSCDASAVQAPNLAPVISNPFGGGGHLISWRWDDGGLEYWTNFRLARYVNGSFSNIVDIHNLEMRFMGVSDYAPACGEVVEFRLRYMGFEGRIGPTFVERNTPWSNTVSWAGEPCAYTASVHFRTLNVHSPPADEDGERRPGPIYGNFWASSGSITETLSFDACHCPMGSGFQWARDCIGLKLNSGRYSISRDIFEWIDREMGECLGEGCASRYFDAPFGSSIHLPVLDGGDIAFGGQIMDCDRHNPNDVLFQQDSEFTINIDELDFLAEPIPLTLLDDHVDLNIVIRLGR